ncbi:uncharacterized protein LOC130500398 [Raphanus sativus]|uniref:Uncharacterized protein LOC130500398 n=1 Tax=Raphanus sativus TaxID=3726 RepID=A0A9W3CJD9_RAPSA|nr:uncharacterized protein LOC130500398 [Raphanus sativus]
MLVVPDGFLSLCSLSESNQIYVSSCYGSPNFGSWKGAISTDSLAPGPSADLSDYLVLAAHRTKRPDILRAFKPYRGGWNITDNHYWASIGFTGASGLIPKRLSLSQSLLQTCSPCFFK